jgi:hypothetical protein
MTNNFLMTLQAEYLSNRDSKSLYQELFQAVFDTALINIKSLIKSRKKWRSPDELRTIADDVCIAIMSRYKNPAWRINSNYGGCIHAECFKRLFDKRFKNGYYIEGGKKNGAKPYKKATFRELWATDGSGKSDEENYVESEENKRVLADLEEKSLYFKQISRRAETAPNYQAYLGFIVNRHSLNWIGENLKNIKMIWDFKRGT